MLRIRLRDRSHTSHARAAVGPARLRQRCVRLRGKPHRGRIGRQFSCTCLSVWSLRRRAEYNRLTKSVPGVRIHLPPPASLNCRDILRLGPRNMRKWPDFRTFATRTGPEKSGRRNTLLAIRRFSPAPALVVRFQGRARANTSRSQSEHNAKAELTLLPTLGRAR
jgi:hypothetical protein